MGVIIIFSVCETPLEAWRIGKFVAIWVCQAFKCLTIFFFLGRFRNSSSASLWGHLFAIIPGICCLDLLFRDLKNKLPVKLLF